MSLINIKDSQNTFGKLMLGYEDWTVAIS
jgi:hypothetical protein